MSFDRFSGLFLLELGLIKVRFFLQLGCVPVARTKVSLKDVERTSGDGRDDDDSADYDDYNTF